MASTQSKTGAVWRPSKEDLVAAANKTVRDIIAPELRVLFCGINPSLYSAATGHHFARPGNRFWRALEASGLTDRLLSPDEDKKLLDFGIGITNIVRRATVGAADLSPDEIKDGARRLEAKVRRFRPQSLAILGMDAYRIGFGRRPTIGLQDETIAATPVYALPNPSGLQARYELPELADAFALVLGR